MQVIPPDLDPGFKQSLKKGRLRYANEYSLRKRLHELAHHLAPYLPLRFLAESGDRNAFVEKATDTRNYLTHYDPELREKAATNGAELYELGKKLCAILDALLLEEIGFEQDQIREMLRKNSKYADLIAVQE